MYATVLLVAMSGVSGQKGCYSGYATADHKPSKVVVQTGCRGCYNSCKSSCRGGLFSRLFGRKCHDCNNGCATSHKGCAASHDGCHVSNGCNHGCKKACHGRRRCHRNGCAAACHNGCAASSGCATSAHAAPQEALKPVPKPAPKPESSTPTPKGKTGAIQSSDAIATVAFSEANVTYLSTPVVVYSRD